MTLSILCLLLAAAAIVLTVWLFRLKRAAAQQNDALLSLREAYGKLDEATGPIREFSSAIGADSHGIQNQLMAIYGYTTLLNQSENLAVKEREMLDGIAKAATILQNLTQSILGLSKSSAAFRKDA
jgi:signal transduction histidine kinase